MARPPSTSHKIDFSKPLLIDNFLYNGEPIVELRLKYLDPYVDRFFITEARYTFSGKLKEQLFFERDRSIFEPYLHKITFLACGAFPEHCTTAWDKEAYQRNYSQSFIQIYATGVQYIVLCCDVDEIPNSHILINLRGWYEHLTVPCHLEMNFYYYNFDWKVPSKWYLQFVINDKGFVSNLNINHTRQHGSNNRPVVIPNAGWHFSYFSSWEDIRRKVESFSHTEYDFEQFKSKDNIEECIAKGLDLFHRGTDLVRTTEEEKSLLPEGWRDLQAKLEKLQMRPTSLQLQ